MSTAKPKWRCHKKHRQQIIEFAIALEENEDVMAASAVSALTCEQYGIDVDTGYDWLCCLPPDYPWWIDDDRLSKSERAKLEAEYKSRETIQ